MGVPKKTSGPVQGEVLPEHSKIGASSMHRWAACPGSVRLSEGIPNRSSKYAEEGTEAHELAAYRLKEGVYDRHPSAQNEEMLEHVNAYVEYIEALAQDIPMSELLIEQRFDLSEIHRGLYGTADAIVYDMPRQILHVVDLKYGAGIPVEVEENEQLMYYGVGALLSLRKRAYKIHKVVLHIAQPRCPHPKGLFRKWATTPERLLDFQIDLVSFAEKTEDPFAPLLPGDHCRFCPASGICPSIHNKAQELAKQEFSEVSWGTVPGTKSGLARVSSYNPKKLSELLHWLPVLEGWIKGVRDFAYAEAEHGHPVPGWKLVAKRATRKWTSPEATTAFFKKEWPTSIQSLMTDPKPEPLSPAQVEKVLHKKQHDKLKPFISAISSGNTLVSADDPRQEVQVLDAKDVFTAIDPVEIDIFS